MHEWIRMDSPTADKTGAQVQSSDLVSSVSADAAHRDAATEARPVTEYRVYKRRFFGLFQLVLLNIIVSWDVSIPAPVTLELY